MATTIKDKTYVLSIINLKIFMDITKYLKIEIVNSYSKDGINWSNPVGIYVSQNNGTKYSPPVVFYMTIIIKIDENSYNSGYDGDIHTIINI